MPQPQAVRRPPFPQALCSPPRLPARANRAGSVARHRSYPRLNSRKCGRLSSIDKLTNRVVSSNLYVKGVGRLVWALAGEKAMGQFGTEPNIARLSILGLARPDAYAALE